jgi:hypothetical protein
VAAFCALSIWLLGQFAVSAQLHGTVHTDADHGGHTCAITLFSEGLENPAGGAVMAVAPALFPNGDLVTPTAWHLTETENRLPPGRGPPVR